MRIIIIIIIYDIYIYISVPWGGGTSQGHVRAAFSSLKTMAFMEFIVPSSFLVVVVVDDDGDDCDDGDGDVL